MLMRSRRGMIHVVWLVVWLAMAADSAHIGHALGEAHKSAIGALVAVAVIGAPRIILRLRACALAPIAVVASRSPNRKTTVFMTVLLSASATLSVAFAFTRRTVRNACRNGV